MMKIVSGNLVTQTRDNDRKFLHSVSGANMFSVAPIKMLWRYYRLYHRLEKWPHWGMFN